MAGERITFADVLRNREFRVLWLADAQSAIGDQIARVALSVLVFERTSSALLTAMAYALTFVPAVLGGVLLSGLADRLPRRQVMVGCDVARALLMGGMAIPGAPLWLLCGLLVLAVLTEAPFMAAESSLIPVILEGEQYVVGTGLRSITNQLAQLAGFAGGGVVIALIGARAGLAVDAATFALSAVLIMLAVKARPAAASGTHESTGLGMLSGVTSGLRLIFTTPKLRILLGLSWLAGLFVVSEGVAAPYASALGGGPVAVGLLMASTPAGTAVGTYLWVRYVSAEARSRWMGPMAAAVGVPLGLCGAHPNLILSLVLWTLAGLFFGYQVQVITEFVRTVPDQQRGQAIGIASSGLLAIQGLGIFLGGVVAGLWDVNGAVASAGLLGTALALALSLAWRRVTSPRPHSELAHPIVLTSPSERAADRTDPSSAGRHSAEEPPSTGRHAAHEPPSERIVEDRSTA
ncbi:MFS transporter [Jatrophihabitans sp.]|uniref:MFS transporter n=1 Tax=Jatrophihabitans sp. TaxID=1932789 RepID=UPI002C715492|nr:MFS transporter [Jatrophihabitans sp.]